MLTNENVQREGMFFCLHLKCLPRYQYMEFGSPDAIIRDLSLSILIFTCEAVYRFTCQSSTTS
jgi:hypothetical protein